MYINLDKSQHSKFLCQIFPVLLIKIFVVHAKTSAFHNATLFQIKICAFTFSYTVGYFL